MNNSVLVQWVQSLADAFHDRFPFLILKFAFDLEDIVELTSNAKLKDEVDVSLIWKYSIKFDQIDVVEAWL